MGLAGPGGYRLTAITVAFAFAVAACSDGMGPVDNTRDGSISAPEYPAFIEITSGASVVGPGDTLQMVAQVTSEAGAILDVSVEWEASLGRMLPNGRYVAPKSEGKDRVIGRVQTQDAGRTQIADTVTVTVSGDGEEVPVLLEISPSSMTMNPGESRFFAAELRTAGGSPIQGVVNWTATGGTVVDGEYTAGAEPGEFIVTATSSDGLADTAAVTITAAPQPNEAPSAEFTSSCTDLSCTFDASGSSDPDGSIASYSWNFGDGTTGSGASRQHTFAAAGSYSVRLTVTDDDGAQSSVTRSVSVTEPANQAPSAEFTSSCTDMSCTFDASGSSDPDGSIASYGWNFGDGTTGSGASRQHTFAAAGSYSVRLTVTDDDGASTTRTRSVTVSTSTPPPAGVEVFPGQSIQAAVDANPPGTVFILKSGVHRRQQVVPKDDNEFHGESGSVLDGEGVTEFAFGSFGIPGARVLVRQLEIRNYAPRELMFGAIQGDNSVDWRVEDNFIHSVSGVGVRLGEGMVVRNNRTVDNDNLGIGGYRVRGALVEGNEISGNGFAGRSGEYSGLKIVAGWDLVLRGNHVHDNWGRGLWLDTDIFDALVEDNLVVANEKEGIWLEVVCGAVVRSNRSEGNGFGEAAQSYWPTPAGIQVVNGTDVEIYENVVRDNRNGIAVAGAVGYPTHDCVPDLRNVWVHDNEIRMTEGLTGIAENFGDPAIFTSRGNRFENNRYELGTGADYFIWDGRRMDEDEWRAEGQDVNGTFQR
jgi:PKD repeat protein